MVVLKRSKYLCVALGCNAICVYAVVAGNVCCPMHASRHRKAAFSEYSLIPDRVVYDS